MSHTEDHQHPPTGQPGADAITVPGPAAESPEGAVDAAVADLASVAERPLIEHAALLGAIHERLHAILGR